MTTIDRRPPASSPAAEAVPLPPPDAARLFGIRDRERWQAGFFLVLPLLWIVAYFFPPMNQDVGVILSVTERWVNGERLYLDVIDVNPPLVFMLTVLPVMMAKVLPIGAAEALMSCVSALALWSVWASYRLLQILQVVERNTAQLLMLPMLMFALIVFPSEMFAQREHLMAIAAIPYLMQAAARLDGKRVGGGLSFAIAVIAALGFALKPHFLIVPLAVEGYLLVARGLRASLLHWVPWLMVAVMAAYALLAWLLTPAYFSFVLPLVLGAYEDIGGTNYFKIITGRHLAPYLFVLLPLTLAAFKLRWPHVMRLTAVVGLVAAVAGVAQDKGWPYHLLPTQMCAALMFAWAMARTIDLLRHDGVAAAHHAQTVTGLMLLLIYCFSGAARVAFYDQMDYKTSQAGQWQRILEKYVTGSSVLVITPGIYPHFPAMNYVDVKQASRFVTVWPLQGAYEGCQPNDPRYHAPEDMTEIEKLFGRMLIEDLARHKPQMVVVDKIPGIPWCGGKEFDFVEYFTMQPAFAAEWRNYTFIASYDRYLLYLRRPVVDSDPSP